MEYIVIIILLLLIFIRFIILNNQQNEIEKFTNPNNTDKIAFCFLTIDNINKSDVWEEFFKGNEDKYSVYMHPKNPENISDEYKKYIINDLVETKWGDVSLVRATLNLFKAAFQDPKNKMFVLVSDSCIPIYNFNYIYNELMINRNKSNIISIKSSTPQEYQYRHNALQTSDPNFLPLDNFKKCSQWCAINRNSIEKIINVDYTDLYSSMPAPDEHYFINICDKFNIPYQNMTITFDNWKDPSISKYRIFPKTYLDVNKGDINKAREEGTLFFRKVVSETKVNITELFT